MNILVPTAGATAAPEHAFYVMDIAKRLKATIIVLHVIRMGAAASSADACFDTFRKAAEESGVTTTFELRQGSVINQIVDIAEEQDVDLILMGASNGLIVNQWISAGVHQNTTIPVLVIPYQLFS